MTRKYLLPIAGIIFSLSMISCVSTKSVPKISNSYSVVEEKKNTSKWTIDAEYPQFEAPEYQKLNVVIEECYKEDLKDFQMNIEYEDFSEIDLQYSYDFKYKIYDYEDLKSVLLTSWSYTGGAHGNTLLYSFCFNPVTQQFLTASEASGIQLDQLALRTRMSLMADPNLKDFLTEDEWFMEGTAPKTENYNTFVMSNKGITVFFEPYKAAPYAAGILEATIK